MSIFKKKSEVWRVIVTEHVVVGGHMSYRTYTEDKLWFAWIDDQKEKTMTHGKDELAAITNLLKKHGELLKLELVRKSS